MAPKISRRQSPNPRRDENSEALIQRINQKPTPAVENPGNIFASGDPVDRTPPLSATTPKIQPK
jgi:hypothetical protein